MSLRVLISSLLVLLSSYCSGADRVALQLKWFHQFQFAGYYAALEQGFYAEEGLEVEIRARDPAVSHIDPVLNGEADFGVSDSSLILQRLQGQPVVVLAPVFQHSPLILLSLAESGINGPQDLIGKRVMRQRGVDDASITAMLYAEGIDEAKLTDLPHNFNDRALLDGEADVMTAYISDQPFFYKQQGVATRAIYPLNYGIDFYGDMIFTREQIMRESPELALRFRRASLKGWAYALEHSEEIVDLILAKYPTDKSREFLLNEAAETVRIIRSNLIETGYLNVGRFQRIASIYQDLGMASREVELSGIDYRDYLKSDTDLSRWLPALIAVVVGVVLLAMLLVLINLRLKAAVRERTRNLQIANQQLSEYLELFDKHIISASTTCDGVITQVSEAFCEVTGYHRDELLGSPYSIVRHPDMPKKVFVDLWQTLERGQVWMGEILNRTKSGEPLWVNVRIEPSLSDTGELLGYTSIQHDITDKKRVEKLSITDQLTGLYNRLKVDQVLNAEEQRFQRYGRPCSVAMLDLDHFKQINDTHGHGVGDQILRGFADLLRYQVRATDLAGRWGERSLS